MMNFNIEKALVLETGQILDIKHRYATITINLSGANWCGSSDVTDLFKEYSSDVEFEEVKDVSNALDKIDISLKDKKVGEVRIPDPVSSYFDDNNKKMKYLLSDGKEYDDTQVLVGENEIKSYLREKEINKLI